MSLGYMEQRIPTHFDVGIASHNLQGDFVSAKAKGRWQPDGMFASA
jgi:hypothetical protein